MSNASTPLHVPGEAIRLWLGCFLPYFIDASPIAARVVDIMAASGLLFAVKSMVVLSFWSFVSSAICFGIPAVLSSIFMELIVNRKVHNHFAAVAIGGGLGFLSALPLQYPLYGAITGLSVGVLLRTHYSISMRREPKTTLQKVDLEQS